MSDVCTAVLVSLLKFLHLQWKCQKVKPEIKSRSREFVPSVNNRMKSVQEDNGNGSEDLQGLHKFNTFFIK